MSAATDPQQYGYRDVLVLAQLLHVNGVSDSAKLAAAPQSLVSTIIREWTGHVSFKLEGRTIGLGTRDELQALYDGLLAAHGVENTVDLANLAYYRRIEDLEAAMVGYRDEFQGVLEST